MITLPESERANRITLIKQTNIVGAGGLLSALFKDRIKTTDYLDQEMQQLPH